MSKETISKAAAARYLGMASDEKIGHLLQAGLLQADESGKVTLDSVLRLQAPKKVYEPCGPAEFKKNPDTAFFVPVSDPNLGLSMFLSESNGYEQAEAALGRKPAVDEGITGWWSIANKNAELLVARQGLIVSVTAGWIAEVARVIEVACIDPATNRKAFLVKRLGAEVRDNMQGQLGSQINQTGRYYFL